MASIATTSTQGSPVVTPPSNEEVMVSKAQPSEDAGREFVLVPREPTPDMNIAGGIAWSEALSESETYVDCAIACYKAMLDKAPASTGDSEAVTRD